MNAVIPGALVKKHFAENMVYGCISLHNSTEWPRRWKCSLCKLESIMQLWQGMRAAPEPHLEPISLLKMSRPPVR